MLDPMIYDTWGLTIENSVLLSLECHNICSEGAFSPWLSTGIPYGPVYRTRSSRALASQHSWLLKTITFLHSKQSNKTCSARICTKKWNLFQNCTFKADNEQKCQPRNTSPKWPQNQNFESFDTTTHFLILGTFLLFQIRYNVWNITYGSRFQTWVK